MKTSMIAHKRRFKNRFTAPSLPGLFSSLIYEVGFGIPGWADV